MRACLVAVTWMLGAAALSANDVVKFYWAGAGEDVATAGGGMWDHNTSVVWRDSSPTGLLVKWTNHRAAIFQGTIGGTVTITGETIAAALRFASTAGPFVFAGSGSFEFNGEGIVNDSPLEQALNFERAILTFSNAASAGSGAHGGRVSMRNDGVTYFNNTATAGRATMDTHGEMHFANQSSAADAAITNSGILIFQDDATSAAAAVTNQGLLNIQDRAHDLAAAAFSNTDGGIIDLTGVNADGVAFGSLTNSAGGAINLGTKRLTVASLNLADGNVLFFNCASGAGGAIHITTSLLGNTKAGGTRIAVGNVAELVAGQSIPLLDWSGAGSVLSVQLADFKLDPLSDGFAGTLSIRDSCLILSVRATRQ